MPRAGLHVDASLLGSIAVLTLISMQMAGFAPALLASKTTSSAASRMVARVPDRPAKRSANCATW